MRTCACVQMGQAPSMGEDGGDLLVRTGPSALAPPPHLPRDETGLASKMVGSYY